MLAYNQLLLIVSCSIQVCMSTLLTITNSDNSYNKSPYLSTFSCIRSLIQFRRGVLRSYLKTPLLNEILIVFSFFSLLVKGTIFSHVKTLM